jgi:hypothetical protein
VTRPTNADLVRHHEEILAPGINHASCLTVEDQHRWLLDSLLPKTRARHPMILAAVQHKNPAISVDGNSRHLAGFLQWSGVLCGPRRIKFEASSLDIF